MEECRWISFADQKPEVGQMIQVLTRLDDVIRATWTGRDLRFHDNLHVPYDWFKAWCSIGDSVPEKNEGETVSTSNPRKVSTHNENGHSVSNT